jgi:hypothetical protein
MLVKDHNLFEAYNMSPLSFEESLRVALVPPNQHDFEASHSKSHSVPPRSLKVLTKSVQSTVFSLQRLPLPRDKDVRWVAQEYRLWIVEFLFPLIRVKTYDNGDFDFAIKSFVLFGWPIQILRLRYEPTRSSESRQLYYIRSGLLVAKDEPEAARLEFRKIPGSQEVIAGLFNYKPSLPWWIYKLTQALAHLWVMKNFGKHLKTVDSES